MKDLKDKLNTFKTDEDRREFLRTLGVCGLGSMLGNMGLFLPTPSAHAQTSNTSTASHPFIVMIGLNSWDGYASGLWQPIDANKYSIGAFNSKTNEGSVNPLINKHVKSGNIVFHNYSQILQSVAPHLCTGMAFARSLQHGTAMGYQLGGNATNAGFLSGAAQVFLDKYDPNGVAIINAGKHSSRLNNKTRAVANVPDKNVASLRASYADVLMPKNSNLQRIWNVHKSLTGGQDVVSGGSSVNKLQLDTYESSLYAGVPASLAATSPLVIGLDAAMDRSKINAKIDQYIGDKNDGLACKDEAMYTKFKNMAEKLKIAGMMAKTGLGYGIEILAPVNGDIHSPVFESSSVTTARQAALVYAMVAAFWDWVVANKMQDDILVVITHEFGRTAYNANDAKGATDKVIVNNAVVEIPRKGTDHGTGAGYLFINGKVPAGMRFGGMSDYANIFGSQNGAGIPDLKIPAYTSTDLVGSMLLRLWGDKFIDKNFMRQYWGDFLVEVPGILSVK